LINISFNSFILIFPHIKKKIYKKNKKKLCEIEIKYLKKISMTTESIKVCCRFRQEFDHLESDYDSWGFDETSSTITLREKKWTYDFILPPETTQEIMYEKVAKKTINEFCD
jgi:hypothetical protein